MNPEPAGDARELFFARLDALSPRDFEEFVVELIQATDDFFNIRREVPFDGVRVDVVADYRGREYKARRVVIEIKKVALATTDLIRSEAQRRHIITSADPEALSILVISGKLTEKADRLADSLNLPIWDPVYLWEIARPGVLAHLKLQKPVAPPQSITPRGQQLKQALRAIQSGNDDALKYQTWVRDVFEYLFVPPLGPVHYEDTDADGRNRRDLILENWAADPFWAQLRSTYSADFIVVDAKNYGGPLRKQPVLDISHYLKAHGCGLFGILVSRLGISSPAAHAIREHWIAGRKLIVHFSDNDIGQMLDAKDSGARAEPFLQRKIADFRKQL